MYTKKFWGNPELGPPLAGNPMLLRYAKYTRWGGTTVGAYSTFMAFKDIGTENQTFLTVPDAVVGIGSLSFVGLKHFAGVKYPIVGKLAFFYGVARLSYDLGVHYGPSKLFAPKPFHFSPGGPPNVNFYDYMLNSGLID